MMHKSIKRSEKAMENVDQWHVHDVHDVHGVVGVHGVTMSPAQGEPRPSGRRCPTTRHISERKQILLSEYGMLLQCTKTLTLHIALE